jgi:exoribonuclease II
MEEPLSGMDLVARAWQAMRDEGFEPDLAPEAAQELAGLPETPVFPQSSRDLRGLLWSSIDNPDSRDLDQVEMAERLPDGDLRVRVGIADVDSLVKAWTALDAHAVRSTTSVYTGIVTFPMLPELLSTDRTSLNPGQDRRAIVVEMIVDAAGNVAPGEVFPALLHNHAKLDYESVGAWLEGKAPVPERVATTPGLEEQIRLQDEAAARLAARRRRQGALELETIEARPVLAPDGRVIALEVAGKNRAHALIENFMVAANTVIARFLSDHGVPALQRIVRSPERWERIVGLAQGLGDWLPETPSSRELSAFLSRQRAADPLRFPDLSLAVVKLLGPGEYALVRPGEHLGHFGLAAANYTHSTAPNRRYPDLITQRLIKATLAEEASPYSESDLDLLARHCTEREDASRKVERLMRKVAAAALLAERLGETFEAVVTGANRKGTFVRVLAPPVEGRVVTGEAGMDVGDRVRVRLIATDPLQGYIDFARV